MKHTHLSRILRHAVPSLALAAVCVLAVAMARTPAVGAGGDGAARGFRLDRPAAARSRAQARQEKQQAVRLEGTLHYDRSRGLLLNDTPLRMTGRTAVFPGDAGRRPEPRRLDGRKATIFGVRDGRALDARLVILNAEGSFGQQIQKELRGTADEMVLSAEEPAVGELRSDAPY